VKGNYNITSPLELVFKDYLPNNQLKDGSNIKIFFTHKAMARKTQSIY